MTKRLHMTAIIVPPPNLAAHGIKEVRYSKETKVAAAAEDLGKLLQTAIAEGVFDQQGTVIFMVQPIRIGPHESNRCPVCEDLLEDNEVFGSCLHLNGKHRRVL